MTDHTSSDEKLPAFQVNVTDVDQVRSGHLKALLSRFRAGEIDPLVLGASGKPEAAVIPFDAFVRLMRHDHREHVRSEKRFEQTISERVAASDQAHQDGQRTGASLEGLAESLGGPAAEIIREMNRDEPGH